MIYYQHKITGEVIASLNNLRDLITGSNFHDCDVITDVIIPDKVLGQGIICHCMTYPHIRENYKRVSKVKALEICPDFGQWRHVHDKLNHTVRYWGYRHLEELMPVRKKPFGISFNKAKTTSK